MRELERKHGVGMVPYYVAAWKPHILAESGEAPLEVFVPQTHQPGHEAEVPLDRGPCGRCATRSVARVDQRSPAKRSFSGMAAPVVSRTRTKVSMPINSPNLSFPILRKKMFSP